MAGERVRYICPICDQEMKFGRHFCWNCKSYVDEPWRYTGGHLPNEGHDGCHPAQTFLKPRSASTHAKRSHGGRSLAGKNTAGKQYTYNRPGQGSSPSGSSGGSYTGSGSNPYNKSGGRNPSGKKPTGCGSLLAVIIFFWVLMQVLVGILLR